MPITETRNEKLDLRLTATSKRILQSAAALNHRSLSEFVLESALARAEEILLDRQRFGLTSEQWKQFQVPLDTPTRTLSRMSRLLNEPSVFEPVD